LSVLYAGLKILVAIHYQITTTIIIIIITNNNDNNNNNGLLTDP
jgi:hypothetical protein